MLSVHDDRARSLAALCLADVVLVNPVRDGLNLVAKEGPLLNTVDGVLVLSRNAEPGTSSRSTVGARWSTPSTSWGRPTRCTTRSP